MAEKDFFSHDLGSVERLKDKVNFPSWLFHINVIFKSQSMYGMVTGTETLASSATADDKTAWKKKDAVAQRIILSTIDRKIMMHVLNCTSSADMYSKLCGIFEQDKALKKTDIMQQFFAYKYDHSIDMASNLSKLENLRYELQLLDKKIADEDMIGKILSILPTSYNTFMTAWNLKPAAERKYSELVPFLIKEDNLSNNASGSSSTENVAFHTKNKNKYNNQKEAKSIPTMQNL
uniref:Beta-Ala-Xaa dipeptidase n=1 Tax=Lygus hesperus TaxID=30085 RepID=A0A0A9XZP2_LYGHE